LGEIKNAKITIKYVFKIIEDIKNNNICEYEEGLLYFRFFGIKLFINEFNKKSILKEFEKNY